jgi:TRAP-type C4-dicarboxylate transport system permease small subunit
VASAGAATARTLERAGEALARIALLAGAAILFVMLALTCVDVFGRYILGAPVNGKTELTRFLMAGLIACALPVVSASREHIAVDLFDAWFTRRAAAARDLVIDLIVCGAMSAIGYWLVFRADRLASRGYVSDFLAIPLAPLAYFVAAMTFVAGLALVGRACLDIIYIREPDLRPEPRQQRDPDFIG